MKTDYYFTEFTLVRGRRLKNEKLSNLVQLLFLPSTFCRLNAAMQVL
jgi:hypothetical protein